MNTKGWQGRLRMSERFSNSHPALFLDRDGIINIDHGYVYKQEDFEFTQGIFDLVKLFSDKGYLIFVITNQSGIGRGYYTESDFHLLTQWMLDTFKKHHISIERVAYCPHTPEKNCSCRKPNTALINEILKTYTIDLAASYLIGDKQSDIDLAINAHICNAIYIGRETIQKSTYSFKTVSECKHYLEQQKILEKN